MEVIKRYDISSFEPWSGAVTLWGIIEKAGKVDELAAFVAEVEGGDEIDETALNDLIWFEGDMICEHLWGRDEDYILRHQERIENGEDPDEIDEDEDSDEEGGEA